MGAGASARFGSSHAMEWCHPVGGPCHLSWVLEPPLPDRSRGVPSAVLHPIRLTVIISHHIPAQQQKPFHIRHAGRMSGGPCVSQEDNPPSWYLYVSGDRQKRAHASSPSHPNKQNFLPRPRANLQSRVHFPDYHLLFLCVNDVCVARGGRNLHMGLGDLTQGQHLASTLRAVPSHWLPVLALKMIFIIACLLMTWG